MSATWSCFLKTIDAATKVEKKGLVSGPRECVAGREFPVEEGKNLHKFRCAVPGVPSGIFRLALQSCQSAVGVNTACFEYGINYQGFTLDALHTAETAEACQELCARTPECHFWSYRPHYKLCAFKESAAMSGRVISEVFISGPRHCGAADAVQDEIASKERKMSQCSSKVPLGKCSILTKIKSLRALLRLCKLISDGPLLSPVPGAGHRLPWERYSQVGGREHQLSQTLPCNLPWS